MHFFFLGDWTINEKHFTYSTSHHYDQRKIEKISQSAPPQATQNFNQMYTTCPNMIRKEPSNNVILNDGAKNIEIVKTRVKHCK